MTIFVVLLITVAVSVTNIASSSDQQDSANLTLYANDDNDNSMQQSTSVNPNSSLSVINLLNGILNDTLLNMNSSHDNISNTEMQNKFKEIINHWRQIMPLPKKDVDQRGTVVEELIVKETMTKKLANSNTTEQPSKPTMRMLISNKDFSNWTIVITIMFFTVTYLVRWVSGHRITN